MARLNPPYQLFAEKVSRERPPSPCQRSNSKPVSVVELSRHAIRTNWEPLAPTMRRVVAMRSEGAARPAGAGVCTVATEGTETLTPSLAVTV